MRRLLKDKGGGVPVLFIGLVFFLLALTFMIMEMGTAYENYYDAETVLQRCCNNAVEANIQDSYRADHILYLDVPGAVADFNSYLRTDMPGKYTVTVNSAGGTATPPNLTVVGTVTYPTLFSQYGFGSVTFNFTVKATNYRIE
jgi:Flp pilus assembly protein TadG